MRYASEPLAARNTHEADCTLDVIADLSPAMVECATQRIATAALSDRVSARQADMQDLSAWQAR